MGGLPAVSAVHRTGFFVVNVLGVFCFVLFFRNTWECVYFLL